MNNIHTNSPERDKRYEILLAFVIGARATSYIFSKMVLQTMGVFNLLGLRFLLGFCVLAIIFHKKLNKIDRQVIISGSLIGLCFFLVMTAELSALERASTSLVSMLENSAIVFVPVLELLIFKNKPTKMVVLSVVLAFAGVCILAISHGELSGGVLFGILSAIFYAIAIIVTSRLSVKSKETILIGMVQVLTMGTLAMISSFIFETPTLPTNPKVWGMLTVLVLVGTCFGFTLQPMAQSKVSAERAGVFCAISPAVATVLGITVLKEKITALTFIGLILILMGIILPNIIEKRKKPRVHN